MKNTLNFSSKNKSKSVSNQDLCGNLQYKNKMDLRGTKNDNMPYNDKKLNDVNTYFEKIDFEKLPKSFVIKCNHGCKWQYIIKDKNLFLQNKRLFEIVRQNITGWLEQEYWCWGGFELNYKSIEPKIIIEDFLENKSTQEVEVYCFNGFPKLILRMLKYENDKTTLYDERLNIVDDVLSIGDKRIFIENDDLINQSLDLSKKLSQNFMFVRIDWIIYENKLYFEEMTFTPYSGFHRGLNPKYNKKLGMFISL